MPTELVALIVLGFILWLWSTNRQAQEIAKHTCARICNNAQVELLDDTVSLSKLRIVRNQAGKASFKRTYSFDYTDLGHNRKTGLIMMQGYSVDFIKIDKPEGSEKDIT